MDTCTERGSQGDHAVNARWEFSIAPTQPKWGLKSKTSSNSATDPFHSFLFETARISEAEKGTKFFSLIEKAFFNNRIFCQSKPIIVAATTSIAAGCVPAITTP